MCISGLRPAPVKKARVAPRGTQVGSHATRADAQNVVHCTCLESHCRC